MWKWIWLSIGGAIVAWHLINVIIFLKQLIFTPTNPSHKKTNKKNTHKNNTDNSKQNLEILSALTIIFFTLRIIFDFGFFGVQGYGLSLGFVFALWFRFLRLKTSFKGSVYELSNREQRFIIIIIALQSLACIFVTGVWITEVFVYNGYKYRQPLDETSIGYLYLFMSPIAIEIFSEMLILYMFCQRLLAMTVIMRRKSLFSIQRRIVNATPSGIERDIEQEQQKKKKNETPQNKSTDIIDTGKRGSTSIDSDLIAIDINVKLDSKQMELIQVITKQTVLSVASCFFLILSVLCFVIGWTIHTGNKTVKIDYFRFMLVFAILSINVLSMTLWLSFGVASKWYNCYCKICHSSCINICQKMAQKSIKKQKSVRDIMGNAQSNL